MLLAGIYGWALEPPDDEDLPPHGHDDHDDDGDGDEAGGRARGRRRADAAPADEPEEVTVGD